MIDVETAKTLARQYLEAHRISFGDCADAFEFPDGSITLHYARTDDRYFRDGILVEVCQSPGTIIVMVNRNDSAVWMPELL